jgi:hypothetical protein
MIPLRTIPPCSTLQYCSDTDGSSTRSSSPSNLFLRLSLSRFFIKPEKKDVYVILDPFFLIIPVFPV